MTKIGTKLYGFCDGYFGRDSYRSKRIEAFGVDWIIARDFYDEIHFATFEHPEDMDELVEKWAKEPEDEENS